MPKFAPYESPFNYLAGKFKFIANLRSLYFKYNHFDDELASRIYNPRAGYLSYFFGGLNPLLDIKKDALDTFKPYKANYYITRDLLQPLRGIGNIVSGLANVITASIILLIYLIRYSIIDNVIPVHVMLESVKLGGGLLDGISGIIRGATQLATSPLTWLMKMPVRGYITWKKGKPTVAQELKEKVDNLEQLINTPSLQDNPGASKTLDDAFVIENEINSMIFKTGKALKRGQKLGVDLDEIKEKIAEIKPFISYSFCSTNMFHTGAFRIEAQSEDLPLQRNSHLAFLSIFGGKKDNIPAEISKPDSLIIP